jgi:hypothetical protein
MDRDIVPVWKELVLRKDRDIQRHGNGVSMKEDGGGMIWYGKEVN